MNIFSHGGRLKRRYGTIALVDGFEFFGLHDILCFMKARVYIETSVISYLTGRTSRDLVVAAHQEVTRQWWLERIKDFELIVSDLVMEEVNRGDAEAAIARRAALEGIPVLCTQDEAIGLAETLLSSGMIPREAVADALHIALAATHGMDYLLTWNCKHIANAQIRNRIVAVVEGAGYSCPVICTPEELLESQS